MFSFFFNFLGFFGRPSDKDKDDSTSELSPPDLSVEPVVERDPAPLPEPVPEVVVVEPVIEPDPAPLSEPVPEVVVVEPVAERDPAPLSEPVPEVVVVESVIEPDPTPLPEAVFDDSQADVEDGGSSAADALLGMTDRAVGLDDPSVSVGLVGLADWVPAMQTIDLIKFSRPLLAHESGQWGGYSNEYLSDNGHLDENGWLQELPEGATHASFHFAAGDTPEYAGSYVLQYEGAGDIEVLGPNVNVTESEPGRIEFTVGGGESGNNTFSVTILDPDSGDNGDYLRDISIVREEHVELHEAGAVFNPDYVDIIADFREVRFKDWNQTDNSEVSEWSDRQTLDSAQWTTEGGVPIEAMVQLANESGVDMWITIPLHATEEYSQNIAAYVRDNLDPDLNVTVELSNELWHGNYHQSQDIWQAADDAWDLGENDWSDRIAYTTKLATENALIWKEAFADEPEGRLEATLATTTSIPWWTEQLLEAEAWFENEPDAAIAPSEVFDSLAITTYYGSAIVSQDESRDALLEAIEDPDVDAFEYLYEQLTSEDVRTSVPFTAENWRLQADLAEEHGLRLVSYEGGSHVHHTWATGLSDEQSAQLGEFLQDFSRSPQTADLYQDVADIWQEIGGGPFNQFHEIGRASDQNSFGLLTGLDDTNARADALYEINAEPAFFEDRGGEHFQQGVVEYGDEDNNVLIGTNEEDYLIGGEGNDILVGGAGDDGLHGGDGDDIALVAGNRADYDITENENGGYDLIHSEGTDNLFEVEHVVFDDQVLSLEDMTEVSLEDAAASDIWELLTAGHGTFEESGEATADDTEEEVELQ